MLTGLKKLSTDKKLIKRLNESATLTLHPEERREQRISNLLSIADDPSSKSARRYAERIIDEKS